MQKTYYLVDLYESGRIVSLADLEVCEYDQDALLSDMKEEGVDDALDLTDYDRIVFSSEIEAEFFIEKYKKTYSKLKQLTDSSSNGLPAILYKRRYLVQTIMGYKMQTYRNYKKEWAVGQIFVLHDQTYFLKVKLTDLSYCKKKRAYCYKFVLA